MFSFWLLVGQREHCISCLLFIYPHKLCFGPRLNLLGYVVGSRYIFLAATDSKVNCIYGSFHILWQSFEDICHEYKEESWRYDLPLWYTLLQFMHPALVVLDLYSDSSVLQVLVSPLVHWCSFNLRPSFQTLLKALFMSTQTARVCFFKNFLEGVLYLLCEVGDLILCRFTLPNAACFGLMSFVSRCHMCLVYEAFCKLAHAAGQANRMVAVSLCLVFPLLEHRHHDGMLPYLWHSSCSPAGIYQL